MDSLSSAGPYTPDMLMQPSPIGETLKSVLPNRRYSINSSLIADHFTCSRNGFFNIQFTICSIAPDSLPKKPCALRASQGPDSGGRPPTTDMIGFLSLSLVAHSYSVTLHI